MCCATSQFLEALVPGALRGFPIQELVIALQAPGEHHLGAML